MSLYIFKYLFRLIFEGELTGKELAESAGDSIQNVSIAMRLLSVLRLVRHPQNRPRSWEINPSSQLNLLLEKLLFISKNNDDIKDLLLQPSVIKIGSRLYKEGQEKTIYALIKSAGISKVTVIKALNKLIKLNLLQRTTNKPYIFYIFKTPLAHVFFEVCNKIEEHLTKKTKSRLTSEQVLKYLAKDESVLILVHYGSTSRGKGDKFSDIDVLAVTRDRISRGEILNRYSYEKIDLNVYSKLGFLQLLRSQPDFVRSISEAKVIKGKDILGAVI